MPNLLTQRRILRPFRPDQISGLALWLDAADASTITFDASSNASGWADKSGNANHASQSNAGLRPSGTGLLNGKTALNFDGSDDFLEIANSASINLGPTLSIFIAHKTDTSATRQNLFNFLNAATGTATVAIEMGAGPGTTQSYSAIRPGVFMLRTPDGSATTSASLIGFFMESSANLTFRKNGAEVATTASAGTTMTGSGTPKLIGARASGANHFDGLIGEIIVYNKRLAGEEIFSLENHLIAKWGTP